MELAQLIRQSIYSPIFYGKLRERSFTFSLKYFYSIVIALCVALTVVFAVSFIPRLGQFVRGTAETLPVIFPDDLVITIHNGQVTSNRPEPVVIPLPSELQSATGLDGGDVSKALAVIDTKEPFSLERAKSYHAIFVLTRDSIVSAQDGDAVTVRSLRAVRDATIDKAKVVHFVATLRALLQWLSPLAVFGIFAVLLIVFSFVLAYLLPAAVIVMAVSHLKRRPLSFGAAYRVALHASTLAIFAFAAKLAFLPPFNAPLFLLLLVVVGVEAWVNLAPVPPSAEPVG